MTLPLWFWLAVAVLLAILIADAVRTWRAGEIDDCTRDWSER